MISQPMLSVIMPVYNATDTVSRALLSILNTPRKNEIEIIVVDDCSQDDTQNVVSNLQESYPNIKLMIMPQNSGGPSAPRNLAIENATGEYVTFVDDDDWVNVANMLKLVDCAKINNDDLVKGFLYVVNGEEKTIHNRLHKIPTNTNEVIRDMVAHQSTTSDFIVRQKILIENNIRYPIDIRIGEDSVFFFEALIHSKSVSYVDSYFWYHTVGVVDLTNPSSTQQCGDREINHQITAWERSQKLLSSISIDYYDLRLHIGFRNLLISIVRFSKGISEETYNRLHHFAQTTRRSISGKMSLHKRYDELYQAILSGDYNNYINVAKRRLLINGYDLKFVLPLIPYLEKDFNVQVDEWTGHNVHNKKISEQLANWTDIFWCEWLLGNSVFYANKKNGNQRLFIRAHGFEVEREFGREIDLSKVDIISAVSFYYFELFSKQFSIPRNKMRLLPNYVEEAIYSTEKSPDSRYNIGLVGALPWRKGLYTALELLLKLRSSEPKFKLYVMGKQPSEVSWIKNNPTEQEYYNKCDNFIRNNNLTEAVIYGGYRERSELYKDIGYVLSLSSSEGRPESFHLAPAEGACAGSMGLILRWLGAEYIYPEDVIFESLDDIYIEILKTSQNESYFLEKVTFLRDFVLESYQIDKFLDILDSYMKQLFLLG